MRLSIAIFVLQLACLLVFSGCAWRADFVYRNDGLKLSVAGHQGGLLSVYVDNDGFQLPLWFDVLLVDDEGNLLYRETIQRVRISDQSPDWVGVESHKQWMWIPDFQWFARTGDEPRYHRRENTVTPGKTKDAPWLSFPSVFKGVVMLSGFRNEQGEVLVNATYFDLGGKQGGEVAEEAVEFSLDYVIEWWSRDYHGANTISGTPDNPNPGRATLRLSIPGTVVLREWVEQGVP